MPLSALVPPSLAQVMMPPLWFFGLLLLMWLGLCAMAAWPVVNRMGPRSRLALVLPSIAGVVVVLVAATWIRLPLDVASAVLLSLAAAAVSAAVQAHVVRALAGRVEAAPVPAAAALRDGRGDPRVGGREVHDPRDVRAKRR